MKIIKNYLLVSPCRNEADYMRQTLDSVIAQSVLPAHWVIVDDGSTDDTPKILAEYAARYPWISVVTRSDRGHRAVGPGVIDAFYAGLETVDIDRFDYLCKLDLDLELPPDYFKTIIEQMEQDPCLGNFSRKAYHPRSGWNAGFRAIGRRERRRANEVLPDRGMQGNRRFRQAGELGRNRWPHVQDEGMDRSVRGSARTQVHSSAPDGEQPAKPVGGAAALGVRQVLHGVCALFRCRRGGLPHVRKALRGWRLGIFWGYLKAMFSSTPRFGDRAFRRFLRRFELRSLLFGKRSTTDLYHRRIRLSSIRK